MPILRLLISALTILLTTGLLASKPLLAGLPPGNALKDPSAILRNALPVQQTDLQGMQHTLELTSNEIPGNKWAALNEAASSTQFLLTTRKKQILENIPINRQEEGKALLEALEKNLESLGQDASSQNQTNFIRNHPKMIVLHM